MTRTALISAAAVAAAFLNPVSAAEAQQTKQTTAETQSGIIISAPRVRRTDERRSVGSQTYRVSVDTLVTYDDLDLATERGEEELEARLRLAAEDVCDWLDELYPNTLDDGGRCATDAYLAANREARGLVLAARR